MEEEREPEGPEREEEDAAEDRIGDLRERGEEEQFLSRQEPEGGRPADKDEVLPREECGVPDKEGIDPDPFCDLLDERREEEQEDERPGHGQVEEEDEAHHLHHEDEGDGEAGKEEEREERVLPRQDLREELPGAGQQPLLGEEPLFLEVLCRDIEEDGARQPEERGGVQVVRGGPGRALQGEDDEGERGDEADDVDVCEDTGEEEVGGGHGREEDRDERELLETPGKHADQEGICEEEEDDRDEREQDEGRCLQVEGEPGTDGGHAEEVREHLAEDDGGSPDRG